MTVAQLDSRVERMLAESSLSVVLDAIARECWLRVGSRESDDPRAIKLRKLAGALDALALTWDEG